MLSCRARVKRMVPTKLKQLLPKLTRPRVHWGYSPLYSEKWAQPGSLRNNGIPTYPARSSFPSSPPGRRKGIGQAQR